MVHFFAGTQHSPELPLSVIVRTAHRTLGRCLTGEADLQNLHPAVLSWLLWRGYLEEVLDEDGLSYELSTKAHRALTVVSAVLPESKSANA